jgi:micrococcal nuclease
MERQGRRRLGRRSLRLAVVGVIVIVWVPYGRAQSPSPHAAPPRTAPPPEVVAAPSVPLQRAIVERIVDGDTLWVRVDEPGAPLAEVAAHEVRLLGLDDARTAAPCMDPDATAFARQTIPPGTHVLLEADVQDTDVQGRRLRYLYLPDGRMFNEMAVAHGVASAALSLPNDRHIDRMYAAEHAARRSERGLWASCTRD